MTLIEVVAAVAILGTILVGVVMAKARHTHQLALAQQRMVAVRAADEMLTHWWAAGRVIPVGASGVVSADPSIHWATFETDNQDIERMDARVVRLEMRDAAGQPLFDVDLVLAAGEDRP